MDHEPRLTAATVVHFGVGDMLYQQKLNYAHFPEVVDLAVINTGLGMLQSSFGFVKQTPSFWDSTYWDASPRPFLDTHTLAYATAIAAWIRGERDPTWANELTNEIKRPMRKSLKYLTRTNDSFFHPSTAGQHVLRQSQGDWLQTATQTSNSKQIVAIRHLEPDGQLAKEQETLLLEKLQSPARSIVLHSISAVELLKLTSELVADELQLLIESRDDEIRAKAMIALTKLGRLDEQAIVIAAKMIDSGVKHVVFAGVVALSSLPTVSGAILRTAERGFVRAMQSCDYEFVGLFAAALDHWLEDPESHVERLLQDD